MDIPVTLVVTIADLTVPGMVDDGFVDEDLPQDSDGVRQEVAQRLFSQLAADGAEWANTYGVIFRLKGEERSR